MELSHLRKSIALVTMAALAACGGAGSSNSSIVPPPYHGGAAAPQSLLTRIVGVGDSLTAGYQAQGFIGTADYKIPNPSIPGIARPTQENGWWALLVEQSSSSTLEDAINTMFDPAKSPLPLIKGPGLDNQIVSTGNKYSPIAEFKGTDSCTYDSGFNQSGFLLNGSARVRMNPDSTSIRDVGVPGLTLHEANTIHQPQTDTCSPLPGIPGLLSDVVNEESGTFWPVLRNFTRLDGHLTEVNAAASLHPTLATVWLGANDVLKYMGSGGRFVGGDRNAAQVKGDLDATISTLRKSGARVVMANLPDIVQTGFFQRVTEPPDRSKDCAVLQSVSYAYCLLALGGLQTSLPYFAKKYHLATPGGCVPASTSKPCGYLTLPGVLLILQYFQENSGEFPNLDCTHPAPGCKGPPGNGLGMNYITPEFAGKVQALNNVVNQGIDDAAAASNAPLVDVHAIFHGLASGDPSNPYFKLAASINPGVCCSLAYFDGILSFDGIHPSNTGYALIAYEFIDTTNKAYGVHIPQVDVTAVYNGSRCSNKHYCYKDPYAPH